MHTNVELFALYLKENRTSDIIVAIPQYFALIYDRK